MGVMHDTHIFECDTHTFKCDTPTFICDTHAFICDTHMLTDSYVTHTNNRP